MYDAWGNSRGAVERLVHFKISRRADAEDVLQEIWLSAWQNRAQLRDASQEKAWLLGIARHKIADYYRRQYARDDLPLEELTQLGARAENDVRETLAALPPHHRHLLERAYLHGHPLRDIACESGVALGTVKSRLHTAREAFRNEYGKGEITMKQLPTTLPAYTIEPLPLAPFETRWEELIGWFLVPRPGEKIKWAMYDWPEKKRTEQYEMEVTGRASVHGIEGVEIVSRESSGGQHEATHRNDDLTRRFVAQLTDTHVRLLAESDCDDGLRKYYTFLDGDAFLDNWGFGPDNRGKEIALSPKGIITREGTVLTAKLTQATEKTFQAMDVVGRYAVTLGGTRHDTICLIDVETYNTGVCSEQFINQAGRTVLWRRYNHNDWCKARYGGRQWTEILPDNDRLTINGETYVHWYDCIQDFVL